MGFTTHTVVLRAADAGSGFAASLKKLKSASAALSFSLRMSVAAELGWVDGTRLAVQVGDDEHHGLIRFKPDEAGTAVVVKRQAGSEGAKRGGPYFALHLGHLPQFVNRAEAKKWCRYDAVDDGWIEVVLPSWADDTGVKRQRVAALPMHRPPALPAPVRTAAMMGDPPAGRSALDQRKAVGGVTRGAARREAEAREAPVHALSERGESEAEQASLDRLAALMSTFALTSAEAKYLKCLMDGRLKSKSMLLNAVSEESLEVDLKTVDVHIHKLRKKLKGHLVEVDTVWGQGYQMAAHSIARVIILCDGGAPGRDADEAELSKTDA